MKFLLFVAAVIAIGVVTILLKRRNRNMRKQAWEEMGAKLRDDRLLQPSSMPTQEAYEGKTEELFIPQTVQDIATLIIPDSLPFAEEMRILKYMCESYPDLIQMSLYSPASDITISLFEQRLGLRLPDDLRALYGFANGMELCGMTLSFDSLQIIEGFFRRGYSYLMHEGDQKDYTVLGAVGDGGSIALEKKTGSLLKYSDGEFTNYNSVTNLLHWLIEFEFDGYIHNDDPVIKGYLKRM